mgnify:CR=1 FL=1
MISAFAIAKTSDYNNAHYLSLLHSNGTEPFITTDVINITTNDPTSERTESSITFPITKEQCQSLYANVTLLEGMLIDTIKSMELKYYAELPYQCQKVLSDYPQSKDQMVRPNYFSDTIYLKGNLSNMKFLDFQGYQIDSLSLGPGQYKFVIRANMAYFGPHKNAMHIANLQLRISEVHYRSVTTKKKSSSTARPRTLKKDVRFFPSHDIIPVSNTTKTPLIADIKKEPSQDYYYFGDDEQSRA